MKQMIKYTLVITALLLVSLGAFAGGDATVIYKLDGSNSTSGVVGTVTYSYSNGTGTITVTPNDGYYLEAADLTVYKTIDGEYAQTRTDPGINAKLEVTASNPDADPSKVTTYSIVVTNENYDYEITANFHQRTSVKDAAVEGLEASYTYTGEAIKPEVTVKVGDNTLTLGTDYRAFYSDSINASTDAIKGKITLYGLRKYTGAKEVEYMIAKADPTLTFAPATATYTFGQSFTKPVLTTTPAGLAVTYQVKEGDEGVAQVDADNGDITPLLPGYATIEAVFAGNGNYNEAKGQYTLTVAKGTAVVTVAPVARDNLTYNGEEQELVNEGTATNGEMMYRLGTEGDFSRDIPKGNVAGQYTVYYMAGTINLDQFNDSEAASITVTIKPKSIANTTITLTPESFTYNGQSQKPEVSVKDGDTALELDKDYTLSNEGGTNVGEYTVTVTGKGNYDPETTASKKYYITAEGMEVTAEGYEGTYDKTAHGIKVNAPEGATIKYGTTEGTYDLDASPTYTDAGEYTVYYRVTKVNAADVTGSAKVKITPAAAAISFKESAVEKKTNDEAFTNELTNTGDGVVTYQSSDTEVASVNENTGEVTIKGSGEATITATVADGTNYTYETKTATYAITVKSDKKDSEISWTDPYMGYVMGTFWWGPRLNNPNNLEVKYSSDDEKVATIDKDGVVTVVNSGECNISAIFEGNDEYLAKTVSYLLEVTKEYKLWVGTTQVTSENRRDILGDGHFYYDEEKDWLIVTDNDTPQIIESRMNDLTVFANGSSRLERIWFNNADNSEATGRLTIISYMNIPGSLYLATSHFDGVISGFSSLNLDDESFMYLLDPKDGVYNGRLMTKEGDVAQSATISQYMRPLVNGHTVVFPPGLYSGEDLRNVVMQDILNTMVQHEGDSEEDDDYYDPAESAIVINNVNTTSGMSLLLFNVEKGDLIPGSDEYAIQFRGGLTFMVPEGEGKITLDLKTEPRFRLMLMVGPTEPYEIEKTDRGEVIFTYNVNKPTYCCLYLAVKEEDGTGGTRIGKRDKHHGTIYSVKISPTQKTLSNPLNGISGFPDSQTPEVELTGTDDPTGIIEIEAEPAVVASPEGDNAWYDLQGRRIEKPTKAGLYIINKKKVVIK